MNGPVEKRTLGIVLLTIVVPGIALGWPLLSQTLQGSYLAIGTLLMVLVAACLTYAGVRLLAEFYLGNGQSEAEREGDSSR